MQITQDEWSDAQKFEADWWGQCINTFGEEIKQIDYASKMGLQVYRHDRRPFVDAEDKSVIDLGGGAVSLLLKTVNCKRAVVVDPMPIPDWVKMRYEAAKITFVPSAAELLVGGTNEPFDEVWIYNVLQHTQDPQQIIENAKKLGKVIRIFEWVDTEPHPGHPQKLIAAELDEWLGGHGRVEILDSKVWAGYHKAYYGVFPTPLYGEVEQK